MVVRVKTPARLHLGFLDLNGELGRLYGSIGVAIDRPNVVLEARTAAELSAEGPEAERVAAFAERFLQRYPAVRGARLCVRSSIPAHVGLGSGTQLALAVGA
ncbi:MAG: beta-ribofuranosylaminobenzene 5'-phosphate synthase family protein, partial [Chloroflexia bacterium]